ncbi:MAG: UbiH/UbiF/VisC/COQ6 family ubiquinone biosynthesis hydroxylase [Gammaproteobacteria bacterium]|nr:UbiH/UbiF/VisC/COQ6 family ubiquinone biosynthesis hydroxylase [Gammaproteobacteria bacterium]
MSGGKFNAEAIIVGAGPVGSTLASLLGAGGVECVLAGSTGGPRPGGPVRALAMTLASRNVLQAAGAWERLPREEIGYFQKMRVWDANGTGAIEFDSAELCLPTLGYIVEQTLLDDALAGAIQTHQCLSAVVADRAESLDIGRDRAVLRLEDGRELSAPLVVGADGFASGVRPLAGIDYPTHEYRQQALVCTVDTERPHEFTAWQRFLPDGPLAFLPLSVPRRCAVVWSTASDRATELLRMNPAAFDAQLAHAFDHTLGAVTTISARGAFPLRRAHAERYCRPRFVLAGDAAHCVHPLAGQGANLGLLDAACLAQVLLAARARGQDIGALEVLRRYERWRRGENGAMLVALDALQKLFGSGSGALQWARNAGLDLVDASDMLKNLIMRLATGTLGDLPLLARSPLPARP